MKQERNSNKQYPPIVFMNTPVSTDNDDVIGISSAVEAIKQASDNDAQIVGVIEIMALVNLALQKPWLWIKNDLMTL